MAFTMSPNMAVYVKDILMAKHFYTEVLGFELVSETPRELEIKTGPNTLFVMEDIKFRGTVHELFVDDLESARDELVSHDCEILRWHGKGRDCYIRDPFGVLFNIWEH